MSIFSLQLPDDLQERAAAQAEASGLSLNEYIAIVLASRIGAQAEAEPILAARAARAIPGRARDILARAGQGNPPQAGDELLNHESGESGNQA